MTRRRALKVTASAVGATLPLVHVQTAAACPQAHDGHLGSLGPGGRCVLKGVVNSGRQKQGRRRDRLHSLRRQQDNSHAGGRGAGAQRARHPGLRPVGSPPVRRASSRERERRGGADQAVRPSEQGRGIPWRLGRQMAGRAGRLGLGAPATVRPHLDAQEFHRRGCHRVVPGQGRQDQGCGGLDVRKAAQDGRAVQQGGFPVRAGLRRRAPNSNQTWGATFGAFGRVWWARATSPSIPNPVREALDYVKRFIPSSAQNSSPTTTHRPTWPARPP